MAVYTPTVRTVVNGEPVEASVTNRGVQDLTQRTDWLKSQIDAATAGVQVVLRQQAITPGLAVGTPVYLDTVSSTFKAALAAIDTSTYQTVAVTAQWQGILLTSVGGLGDVLIAGVAAQTPLAWAPVFEDGVFAAGPVFLSESTSGKFAKVDGALGIYIGVMRSDGLLVTRGATAAQFAGHIHLQRALSGNPAGTVIDPISPTPQTIAVPNPALQGWLPATNTYFPGFVIGVQIPTGAQFGYNIQQPSETALRDVFPMVPPDNAVLVQLGLVLDSTKVVVNQYGIWWMDNSFGNAPWSVTYNADLPAPAPTVHLWTSQLLASEDFVSEVSTQVLQVIQANIGTISVARIVAGTAMVVTGTSSDVNGAFNKVTVTNDGVLGNLAGYGVKSYAPATGLAGLVNTPVKGQLRLFSTLPRDASLIPGVYSVPRVLSSFGMDGGTPIGMGTTGFTADVYGHSVNNTDGDFLFRFDPFAATELPVVPAQLKVRLSFAVNAAASVTSKTFYASLFCVPNAAVASSNNSLSTSQLVTFTTATPGTIYSVELTFASVTQFLNVAQTCFLRVNKDTITPATALDMMTMVMVGCSYVVEPVNLTT